MISVCSTTYRETKALEIFVRSLLLNASDPKEIEIIITNDEDNASTRETLGQLRKEFPQLSFFPYKKEERIRFFKKQIDFYQKNNIFAGEEIGDMYYILDGYESGRIDNLWYTCTHGYNEAVKRANGEYLVIMPSDYICFFDINKIVHALTPPFLRYFDWLDFSSDLKTIDCLGDLKKGSSTKEWCLRSLSYPTVGQQHGSRIIDKKSFDLVGGFDDRWFVRAFPDDKFNFTAKKIIPPPYSMVDQPDTGSFYPFIGSLKESNSTPLQYLTNFYSVSGSVHAHFMAEIMAYLAKEKYEA